MRNPLLRIGQTPPLKIPNKRNTAAALETMVHAVEQVTHGGTKELIKHLDNFVDILTEANKLKKLLNFARSNSWITKLHSRYANGKDLLVWLQRTDSTVIKSILIRNFGENWEQVVGRTRQLVKLGQLRKPTLHSIETLQKQIDKYFKLVGNSDTKAQDELLDFLLDGTGIKRSELQNANIISARNAIGKATADVSQTKLNKFQGNLGEFLVLSKRLEHLADYHKALGDKFDEIAFFPSIRADYRKTDGVTKQLNQLTTDGAILGKRKGVDQYEFIDFCEVKATQGGAIDALKQIHRRSEDLDEEGIKAFNLLAEKYVVSKKGIERVPISKSDEVKLSYERNPKKSAKNTISGFHSAKDKRIFAPNDRNILSGAELSELATTNAVRHELVEGIGMDYEEVRSLAVHLLSGLLGKS